jgi:hypothetical protein
MTEPFAVIARYLSVVLSGGELSSPVPKVGLEPTPSCEDRILSPILVPYSWHWKHFAAMLKVPGFKAVTTLTSASDVVVALG